MLIQPQTQKKEVSTRIQKYSEKNIYQGVSRKDMTKGFLLLRKCVPGIEKLNRSDMLMKTVNYIKELQNKIKELEKESPMESTPLTPKGMGRDSVPKITLHHYGTEQDCTDSAPREPLMPEITSSPTDLDTGISSPTDLVTGLSSLMEAYISEPNSPTDISEPEMADPTVKTFASTPTGASEEKSSRETSCAMDDHSAILESLRNKILGTPAGASEEESWRETSSPMDVTVQTTSEEIPQWVIVSPEEEELPEFNSVEDLRQWLGL
jgi:hypothetical protein